MTERPSFDALERGHVVLAPDPFKSDDDATRPWIVINESSPPFDGEQYVVMGLTTRTWYEERIPLADGDFSHGSAPRDSSIIPHAVTSLGPELMTDYVCQVKSEPIDRAVEQFVGYIGAR